MGRHSGSHHSSSSHHSGSHHRSSSHHSGSHHRSSSSYSSGGSSGSSYHYSRSRTSTYRYRASDNRYYSDNEIPVTAVRYGGTWYDRIGHTESYGIDMDDPYVTEHYDKTKVSWFYRLTNTSPGKVILLFYLFGFSLVIAFGLASSNLMYELLIPIFENIDMTDLAFYVVDEGIYYSQFVAAICYMIGVPVITFKKCIRSREYELGFVKQMLVHYNKLEEVGAVEYLTVCPGCGAAVDNRFNGAPAKYCDYCGRSLRADDNR